MGGEKAQREEDLTRIKGSPPHGRGKGRTIKTIAAFTRITPAWAGKRLHHGLCIRCPWDHPRMGGEKHIQETGAAWRWGSPPHGRGKVCIASGLRVSDGITPAWAGKSTGICYGSCLHRDHPRMGGEKPSEPGLRRWYAGSPPHGRGKVPHVSMAAISQGITPAWAGKRAGQCWGLCSARDHPRMGGEKLRFRVISARELGSPPHGRGKERHRRDRQKRRGITPAWAGKRESLYRTKSGN